MTKKFDELIALIEPLKTDEFGEWIVDKGHKGTMEDPIQFPYPRYSDVVNALITAVYNFDEKNPDFDLKHYHDILSEHGLEWGSKSLQEADASNMDAQGIMGMLMGLVRGERFCDGAILSALKSGAVLKWLERLNELVCN